MKQKASNESSSCLIISIPSRIRDNAFWQFDTILFPTLVLKSASSIFVSARSVSFIHLSYESVKVVNLATISLRFDPWDIKNVEKKWRSNPSNAALTLGNSYSGIKADLIYDVFPSTASPHTAAHPLPLPMIGCFSK